MPKKPQKETTTITERDIKLLWGRAAARCSFPGCGKELSMDNSAGDSSIVGEMAHIIGESEGGPRGESLLTVAQRNSYPNLILLCAHHHKIIDKKENWDDYPVELLHEFKAEHEIQVREFFLKGSSEQDLVSPTEMLYADLVDSCVKIFHLNCWAWFSENAIRQLVTDEVDESLDWIARMQLGTLWPGRLPELERSIQSCCESLSAFVEHFHQRSLRREDGFYVPDLSFKKVWDPKNYHRLSDELLSWRKRSFLLFGLHTCDLNDFADVVRKQINPAFYLTYGRFLLEDPLGNWHGGNATIWLPDRAGIEDALIALEGGMHDG